MAHSPSLFPVNFLFFKTLVQFASEASLSENRGGDPIIPPSQQSRCCRMSACVAATQGLVVYDRLLVMVVRSSVCLGYIFCFSLSLVFSTSNYPCYFVYGCAMVVVSSVRWTMKGSWFPMTKDDLGNLIQREVAPRVCDCLVYVALEV